MSANSVPSCEVRLHFTGTLDPNEVSRRLALEPTASWRRGETRREPTTYKDSGWVCRLAGPLETWDTDLVLVKAFEIVAERQVKLKELSQVLNIEPALILVIYVPPCETGTSFPAVVIRPTWASVLSAVGMRFEVDGWLLRSDAADA